MSDGIRVQFAAFLAAGGLADAICMGRHGISDHRGSFARHCHSSDDDLQSRD